MEYSFILTVLAKFCIHLHKPHPVLKPPNTIFSEGMCGIKAQSSEYYHNILSDQKQHKNSGHHRLKF